MCCGGLGVVPYDGPFRDFVSDGASGTIMVCETVRGHVAVSVAVGDPAGISATHQTSLRASFCSPTVLARPISTSLNLTSVGSS